MAQRPKAAASLHAPSGRATPVVRSRTKGWGRFLVDPALPLLIIGTLLVVLLAYQPSFPIAKPLAVQPTDVRMTGVYPAEGHGDAAQRWTTERATLRFVGVGAGSYSVALRFHGGADAGAGRTLTVTTATGEPRVLASLPVRPAWQEITFLVPSSAVDRTSGDLALALALPAMRGSSADPRSLGIALSHVTLDAVAQGASVRIPPAGRTGQLLFVVVLVFVALRVVAVPSLIAGGVAGLLGGVWGLALVWARLDAVLLLDIAQRVVPWMAGLAALLRVAPWAVSRSVRLPAAVSCAVLLIFALRYGGLLHPQYIMVDQKLRANQLVMIAAGRADVVLPQLEQQYEWGTREPVPYSLITYDMLVPLTWFFKDDDLVKAIAATSALLDATMPLVVWALLRDRKNDIAASLAALCYATLPVGYLFFHDGSFPTTIGLWFVGVALVAVRWLIGRSAPVRRQFVALKLVVASIALGLAVVAYVTHLAFVPFLVGSLAASLWLFGGDARRARLVALALVIALVGGWLIYYRDYTVTLIQRTIPAFVQRIAEDGSVGRDTDLLYATAVNTPIEHLYAHFRVWPALAGTLGLLVLFVNQRTRFATHLGVAYGMFFAATLLAEQWFGLWNKHMAFVAPGVALLAGVGLACMWRRGPVGRLICVALLVFLFWESTLAWGNRVLWYTLPPSAL